MCGGVPPSQSVSALYSAACVVESLLPRVLVHLSNALKREMFYDLWSVCVCGADVEGKRSSGLTAVWLARNRFAVLDKTHQVSGVLASNLHYAQKSPIGSHTKSFTQDECGLYP